MGKVLGMETVKTEGKRLPFGSDEEIEAYRERFGELADKPTFEVARTVMLHLDLLRQRVDLSYRGIWCQFGEQGATDYGYAIEGHMLALHEIIEDIRSEEWDSGNDENDKPASYFPVQNWFPAASPANLGARNRSLVADFARC